MGQASRGVDMRGPCPAKSPQSIPVPKLPSLWQLSAVRPPRLKCSMDKLPVGSKQQYSLPGRALAWPAAFSHATPGYLPVSPSSMLESFEILSTFPLRGPEVFSASYPYQFSLTPATCAPKLDQQGDLRSIAPRPLRQAPEPPRQGSRNHKPLRRGATCSITNSRISVLIHREGACCTSCMQQCLPQPSDSGALKTTNSDFSGL